MRKDKECNDPSSCLNKAWPDEMLFVLLGRDPSASATIRFWVAHRISRGLNRPGDAKLVEALACAAAIDHDQAVGVVNRAAEEVPPAGPVTAGPTSGDWEGAAFDTRWLRPS